MSLSSQCRQIVVWFSGSKINYVIPTYTGLESVLGANLEIALDLSSSNHLHTILTSMNPKHSVFRQVAIPKNTVPLPLNLGFERLPNKTVLIAREARLSQNKNILEEDFEENVFCKHSSGKVQENFLR